MSVPEGQPGTWAHCGNTRPHHAHMHSITMNEGTYHDVQCLGAVEPSPAIQARRHTARLRLDVRRIVADLGLPAEVRTLAIEARQDPLCFDVIVEHDTLPPVSEGVESPVLLALYGDDGEITAYQILGRGTVWTTP